MSSSSTSPAPVRESRLQYATPAKEELPAIAQLEALSYPSDEKASPDTLKYRLDAAAPYFLGGYLGEDQKELIGYVCGTASELDELTHDSMYTHVPDGTHLNIHSVTVQPDQRRKGFASELLQHYLAKLKEEGVIKTMALICKENLIPLYQKAGFKLIGPSSIVHGKEQWFDMKLTL